MDLISFSLNVTGSVGAKPIRTAKNSLDTSLSSNEKLEIIRNNFKRINSIKNWTVIDSVELEESTEGGQAKFYFANKQLQKIVTV